MSTKWVKGEHDRSCKQHNEHWRVRDIQQDRLAEALKKLAELEKENEELRAKLTVLHRKQFKANRKKDQNDEPIKKPGV